MLNIEAKTKFKPEEVIEKAVDFFGPGGYGLEVKGRAACCLEMEGGGGGIDVNVKAAEKGKGSTVNIETREWENQVKEFLTKIK
ncbi:MAG TPA: hypothetical protein VMB24_06745 [Dehalococcoidales bacterium]|nr:hypothetical protein [Dehalococcoidales bacterium]